MSGYAVNGYLYKLPDGGSTRRWEVIGVGYNRDGGIAGITVKYWPDGSDTYESGTVSYTHLTLPTICSV